jgi:UDP-3-O-[3-hydroxymyristoyl] glucosamine N-acyltransferase
VITHAEIFGALGINISKNIAFGQLGLANCSEANTLTFCDDKNYVSVINENDNILGVFCTPEIGIQIENSKELIAVDDPRWYFYTLYNYVARKNYTKIPTVIDKSAKIHETAFVSDYNVIIGKHVMIGPNSTILPDVIVNDNCRIGASSVLGCDDLEIKDTSRGLLKVFHDGKVKLSSDVSIGCNCTITKGFFNQDTTVGSGSFVSNNSFIGHRVQIGVNSLILACIICGSAKIGNNVRINPGAVVSNQINIGDNASVTLGSVVVKDVEQNKKVTGNFAIEHNWFMYKYYKIFGSK